MSTTYWLVLPVAIVAAALFESRFPHHRQRGPTTRRLIANSVLLGFGALLGLILVPASLRIESWWFAEIGPGLGAHLPPSPALTLVVAFVAYDLQRYVAHRLFHTPYLWRLHALHHSDVDVDWSTNFRHHPFEMVAAMLFAAVGLGLFGIGVQTIAALAIVHVIWDMLVHSNITLPRAVERRLEWLLVSPSMHRLHHSASRVEADSNYGAILSVWDRLFGTLRDGEPARFGLETVEPSARAHIVPMLLLPFGRIGEAADRNDNNPVQET